MDKDQEFFKNGTASVTIAVTVSWLHATIFKLNCTEFIKKMNGETNQEIICHCSGTTRQQITVLVENNIACLEDISRRTGAAAGCGACETWVTELLEELNGPKAQKE